MLRVGGVPEHFNLPWHLALERGLFSEAGVRVEWHEYKLGTGAMVSALENGEVDLVIALSEGLVAAIAQGAPLKLLATYVESPLRWAISTGGAPSAVNEVADLRGGRIGISRFTSGSHLMSCVLASQRGWAQSDLEYVVEGNFESLRRSVNEGRTAAFMWEHFTSKPYYDSGELRRIGEIATPWPCFLLASAATVLADPAKREALRRARRAVQQACSLFRREEGMASEVSKRYGLREEDAAQWYAAVRITASEVISESTLEQPLQALKEAGILTKEKYPADLPLSHFVDSEFATLQPDIRSAMRLYHRPELLVALHNNLRRAGKERGPLGFRELLPFDQNHYGGTDAIDRCVEVCGLTPSSRVLQLGSSVGGPARYLAGTLGCAVLAVELQEGLSAAARELTARCSLQELVHHVSGDFLQVGPHLAPASYDCICSWLTQLHFSRADRARLFSTAARLLKPGGALYAEDFVLLGSLTPLEEQCLRRDVFCSYLPSRGEYAAQLTAAGMVVEQNEELTAEWTAWTRARADKFQQQRAEQLAAHGEEIVAALGPFYEAVAKLFEGGHVGGVRILARKPAQQQQEQLEQQPALSPD